MPLFVKSTLSKLKDFLLLNAYTVEPAGLMNGKTGITLTLFELALIKMKLLRMKDYAKKLPL